MPGKNSLLTWLLLIALVIAGLVSSPKSQTPASFNFSTQSGTFSLQDENHRLWLSFVLHDDATCHLLFNQTNPNPGSATTTTNNVPVVIDIEQTFYIYNNSVTYTKSGDCIASRYPIQQAGFGYDSVAHFPPGWFVVIPDSHPAIKLVGSTNGQLSAEWITALSGQRNLKPFDSSFNQSVGGHDFTYSFADNMFTITIQP